MRDPTDLWTRNLQGCYRTNGAPNMTPGLGMDLKRRIDQHQLAGPGGCAGPCGGIELAEDSLHVGLHGGFADEEPFSAFAIAQAFRHSAQYFQFPGVSVSPPNASAAFSGAPSKASTVFAKGRCILRTTASRKSG